MLSEKHFIDTSVMRPLISSSSVVKEYYKQELTENLYYCSYIKMEFIRGFINPAISFYFTLRMPNIHSISDAISLWSQKFQTRELKAILSMFSGLLEGQRFDFNDLKEKEKASQRVADYIRRILSIIPNKFKDIGVETKLCAKSNLDLEFLPNDLDNSFRTFLDKFNSKSQINCNLHLFIPRHQKEINKIIANKNLVVSGSKPDGFQKIVEELSSQIKCNCTTCMRIGDLIIALISPKEMRMEHTDYSFDYLMLLLNKRHFRHPSEHQLINS
jgi:hypothetical protein